MSVHLEVTPVRPGAHHSSAAHGCGRAGSGVRDGGAAVSRAPARVALDNADELIRHGLTALLLQFEDRVALIDTELLHPSAVDVLLTCPQSGASGGSGRIRSLVAAGFDPVVAFGWGLSLGERRRLQEAGAHGYVSVGVGALALVELLEGLAHLPGTAHPTPSATALPLSGREAEIMALITRGLTNQEIAGELFLSINTVKTYIRGAYQKIGVARRAQAVAWGIENGLAPLDPRPARSRSPL